MRHRHECHSIFIISQVHCRAGSTYKMKLLQSVRKYLKIIGIYSPRPNQHDSPISWRSFLYFIDYAQIIVSSVVFMTFEGKTAAEYGYACYTFICSLAATAAVLISIWKKGEMFNLLHEFEKFIDKSK